MGFTRSAWVRQAAYHGSLNQAGVKELPTQSAATMAVNSALTTALAESDRGKLLTANAAKGTSTWFTDPKTRMHPRDFSAAMRLRLGSAHPALAPTVTCPGCGIILSNAAWSQHVAGCTRLRGINASTRHAQLKDALKLTAKMNGVACSVTEPRFIKTVKCPGCSDDVKAVEWQAHADGCTMLPAARKKEKPHASGPDIEAVWIDDHVMIDVTVVNPLNHSAKCVKPGAIFNRVEADKEKRYGAEVAKVGARLAVAAITAQGALSPAFERLLAKIAPGDAYFDARRALVAATVAGSGAALRNAESQLGACSRAVAEDDNEEDDGMASEADEEETTTLPEWMAAMVAQPPSGWGTIVADAIAAARGNVESAVEEAGEEQPQTQPGTVAPQTVPTAAAADAGALNLGTNTKTKRTRSALVKVGEASWRLDTQLETIAREQQGTEVDSTEVAKRTRSVSARPLSSCADGEKKEDDGDARRVEPSVVSDAYYGNGAARQPTHGRRTATRAASADSRNVQGSTRTNSSFVGPKRLRSASRWALRTPPKGWWEAENPFFR
jgi:hypothetical protein